MSRYVTASTQRRAPWWVRLLQVLLVVVLVLVALLRAVVAPLVLILTVVLSFFAALGAGSLAFTHVFDFPALDYQVPLLAFLFLVALGVDVGAGVGTTCGVMS